MALGFPQVLGVGYDTMKLARPFRAPCLPALLPCLVGRSCWHRLSNARVFVGGGFAPSLFAFGAVLGKLLNGPGGLGPRAACNWAFAEPPA